MTDQGCIECGDSILGYCGCCGAPLCSRHVETQAGFCSDFKEYEFEEGETLEVTDGLGLKDLVEDEIRFLEDVEINGCLFTSEDPEVSRLFFPMDELPEGKDEPISELEKVEYEVVE
jgi:hypothetical protein